MTESDLFVFGLCCAFVCSKQGALLHEDTIALVCHPFFPSFMEKSITVDTSLIPFIYFVSGRCIFKEGQDARIAKCVPNKWYPSQDGSSLESVLAKGSKSMGLRQHPGSLGAGTHSGGTDGLSWLGSSKGLWPRASRLLGELAAPLRPLSEGRWKPSRERITMRRTVEGEWWISEFYQMRMQTGAGGHALSQHTLSKRARHSFIKLRRMLSL